MPLQQLDYLKSLTSLPALTSLESAVAKAWLDKHAAEYDSVEFNVRLGQGILLPSGSPEYLKQYARASTTKRADLILKAGNVATIVEVKVRIGGSALGQLQLYRMLYLNAHPEVNRVLMVAAGQTIEPDVEAILEAHDVKVELFPV